jgi:hypothetical protein
MTTARKTAPAVKPIKPTAPMKAELQPYAPAVDLDATGEHEFRFVELGELATSSESSGFDPYNSSQGKSNPEAWKRRNDRR